MNTLAITIQRKCDVSLAGCYYRVVCFMLCMMVIFTGRRGYQLSMEWDPWIVGEWLISYASGFVRRGLSGELLLLTSDYSGVQANISVFIALFSLFTSFCLLFAGLLRNKEITFWYLFLCVSPGFLLFTFYNEAAIGRKEILIFVAFLVWAKLLADRTYPRLLFQVLFGIVCFFLTLMYEGFFFFTPYFVFLSFLISKLRGIGRDWRMSLLVPCCSLLALLVIVQFSGSLNDPALCDRLTGIGAPREVCDGILSYGDVAAKDLLTESVSHFTMDTLLGVVSIFPIILVPIYVFLVANVSHAQSLWKLCLVFCAFILFSSPLFVLAVDWGRWISIHIVLLTITCSYFLRDREHGAHNRMCAVKSLSVHLVLGLIIISSNFCWSLKYCCGDSFLNAFGPIKTMINALNDANIL